MTSTSADADLRPIPVVEDPNDPVIELRLSRLRWVRDQIARLRGDSPLAKRLWEQVSSLYIEKEASASGSRKPS